MSLAGEEKLFDAHKTQHKIPIHRGLVASNETAPPLAELLITSQTDLFSSFTDEVATNIIVLVIAAQLQEENAHWLELAMVAGENSM